MIKKKLYRLIDIYLNFVGIVDSVRDLNIKVEKLKKIKDLPVEED